MEKRELKERILKAVGFNSESIDQVFDVFIKKIDEVLQVNQTIRIENVGFFQLRVEPVSRLERDLSKKSKRILIFKNIERHDQTLDGSPFLTIKIEHEDNKTSKFNDSVFNLSIDKPSTIFTEDQENTLGHSDEELSDSIEETVKQVIASGIILDGYELLNKESQEESDHLNEEDHLTSELFLDSKNKLSEELISHPDEPSAGLLDHEIETSDEKISSEFDQEIKFDKPFPKGDDVTLSIEEDNKIIHEPQFSNPFDELNDLINKEKEPQAEEKVNSQELFDEVRSSVRPEETGSKRLMFLAFAAVFVILLIAIIYFTYAPNDDALQMRSSVEENKTVITEVPIQTIDSTIIDSSIIAETSSEVVLLKEDTPEIVKHKVEVPNIKTNYTGLYRKISKDISITDRIYFDGLKYSVQISSWKSKTIAEHEVKRLNKLGFDAFIYQLYIKSKDGTYNRVRIGYFETQNQATEFLKRNKL